MLPGGGEVPVSASLAPPAGAVGLLPPSTFQELAFVRSRTGTGSGFGPDCPRFSRFLLGNVSSRHLREQV